MAKKAKKGFPVTKMEHNLVKFSCGGFVHISGKKIISNFAEIASCGPHVLSVQKFTAKKSQGGKLHRLFSHILFPRNNGGEFHSGENESFVFSSSSEEIFEMSEK